MHGYHVYKAVWTLFAGEFLTLGERMNIDRNAVAVALDSCVVGHLPQEYSRIAWHFLQHGGKSSCEITGRRWRGLGLVVPCVYKFQGKEKLVVKLQKVINKRN